MFQPSKCFDVRFDIRVCGDGSRVMRIVRVGHGEESVVAVHTSKSTTYLNTIKERYARQYRGVI